MSPSRMTRSDSGRVMDPSDAPLDPGGSSYPGGTRGLASAALIVAVLAVVAAAHWPVLGAQALSLDDNDFVTHNPLVTHPSWQSARRFFTEVLEPSTVQGYYVPVTMTSLMLDYALGGRPTDLRAFHRTSLALHIASVALVVLILHRLLGALLPAAAAGLLFGLHPLTVEPVAWIAGRKALLAACLAFASVLCWLEHRHGGRRAWLTASVGLYALALMSKPAVLTLPFLLLLLDSWPLRRFGRSAVIEKWPFLLLSLISVAVSTASLASTSHIVDWPRISLLQMFLQVCYLPAFYLAKTIWPGELSCIYPPPDPWAITNPVVLLAVVTTGVLGLAVALAARRTRAPLVGALFFVLALAPTFGILKWSRTIAYDNYVYFPALGLLLPLGYGLGVAWERSGRGPRLVLAALVLLAGLAEAAGTRAALRSWKDSTTLWRHIVTVAPGEASAHNGLGTVLLARSDAEGAIREFRRAIELGPGYPDLHSNLGAALVTQGRVAEAIEPLKRASELGPGNPAAAYALGVALLQLGRMDEAEQHLRRAMALKPGYTEAADRLGSVLVQKGRTNEGIELLRRSAVADSTNAHPHFALAVVLLRQRGLEAEAVAHLRQSIRYGPDWWVPWNELAWLLATTPDSALRDGAEALRLATRAVELTGGRDPAALDTQAAAEAAAGRFDRAGETARIALDLAARAGRDSLARDIRTRLARYERRAVFTDSVGPASFR